MFVLNSCFCIYDADCSAFYTVISLLIIAIATTSDFTLIPSDSLIIESPQAPFH